MQLLAEITANLVGHVGQGGQIAQMLVTFEEHQEGQVLGRSSRMGGDKGLFLLGRRVEPLVFGGGERRREVGVGGAFNRSHRRSRPPAVSEKGCPGRGVASLVFPGETAYRKPVRKARLFWTTIAVIPRYTYPEQTPSRQQSSPLRARRSAAGTSAAPCLSPPRSWMPSIWCMASAKGVSRGQIFSRSFPLPSQCKFSTGVPVCLSLNFFGISL